MFAENNDVISVYFFYDSLLVKQIFIMHAQFVNESYSECKIYYLNGGID